MDAPVKGQWLAERVASLKDTLLQELSLQTDSSKAPQSSGRSHKRRADVSESGHAFKAARCQSEERKKTRQPEGRRTSGDYFAEMYGRRAFHASDCVGRLSKEFGVRYETEGCAGTLIRSYRMHPRTAESVWKRVKGALDVSWAEVALEEGVRFARSGKYAEAMESYEQALRLNPRSCDAFVARGAAQANQGNYPAALKDFDKALDVNPNDRNATEYKQRIEKRKQERESRSKPPPTTTQPRLEYREGLFGRGLPLAPVERKPDEKEVQTALAFLKRSHKKKEKKSDSIDLPHNKHHRKKRHRLSSS